MKQCGMRYAWATCPPTLQMQNILRRLHPKERGTGSAQHGRHPLNVEPTLQCPRVNLLDARSTAPAAHAGRPDRRPLGHSTVHSALGRAQRASRAARRRQRNRADALVHARGRRDGLWLPGAERGCAYDQLPCMERRRPQRQRHLPGRVRRDRVVHQGVGHPAPQRPLLHHTGRGPPGLPRQAADRPARPAAAHSDRAAHACRHGATLARLPAAERAARRRGRGAAGGRAAVAALVCARRFGDDQRAARTLAASRTRQRRATRPAGRSRAATVGRAAAGRHRSAVGAPSPT
eukprot:4586834-Prymnesium_polylepis.1